MTNPRPESIERLGMTAFPSFAMVEGMPVGLFTTLHNGPLTAEGTADTSGIGSAKLKPLLYALVAAELLTVEEEFFSNTIESDHYLVKGKSGYLGSRQKFYPDLMNDVLHVAESIRIGTGQTKWNSQTCPRMTWSHS